MRFFSIAGPINQANHYYLPLDARLNEQELRLLIEQKQYFVLHAPRKTGKTSTMLNFARQPYSFRLMLITTTKGRT